MDVAPPMRTENSGIEVSTIALIFFRLARLTFRQCAVQIEHDQLFHSGISISNTLAIPRSRKVYLPVSAGNRNTSPFQAPLFCPGICHSLLVMAPGEEREIVAEDIDGNGGHHEKQTDPDAPIAMRPFPIRVWFMMNTVASRRAVLVGTVLEFIHRFSAFSIPCLAGT